MNFILHSKKSFKRDKKLCIEEKETKLVHLLVKFYFQEFKSHFLLNFLFSKKIDMIPNGA